MSSWLVVAVVSFLVGAIFGAGVLMMAALQFGKVEPVRKLEEQVADEKYRRAIRGRYTP